MTARPRIGFVGIGIMGAPMVRRLMAQGWPVAVWNLEADRYAEVPGATVLDSPAAVRAASDIVIFCVLHGEAVEQCCFGPHGMARAASGATLLIDTSTINPDTTLALAERLKRETGMAWVDAPISGGPVAADDGHLTIMMGGADDDVARASTVLRRIYPQQQSRDYVPPRSYARQLDKDLKNVMAFVKAHNLELPLLSRAVERYHAFAADNEMVDGAAVARLYEKPKS